VDQDDRGRLSPVDAAATHFGGMSTDQPRQPGGVPTGGEFTAKTHAEPDVTLGGSTLVAPWEPTNVHDLVTSMAPRLAADIAAARLDVPANVDPLSWLRDVDSVRVAFESVDTMLDGASEPERVAAEARFEAGMATLRARRDPHLAAIIAPTASSGLRSYAEMRRTYPAHMTADEWAETIDTMIAGFDSAASPSPDQAKIDAGVEAFGRNYVSLWS
jgi:hypothetical protein